jgi:hypothetical protein
MHFAEGCSIHPQGNSMENAFSPKYIYILTCTKLKLVSQKIQTIWMSNYGDLMAGEMTMIAIAFDQDINKLNRASINFELTSVGQNMGQQVQK